MIRPILGISMGDPFGNGPEITVRALLINLFMTVVNHWLWVMRLPCASNKVGREGSWHHLETEYSKESLRR